MRQLKFYRYLAPFWRREVFILFLTAANTALGLINPYLAKLIIDKAYGNRDLKLFIMLIAVAAFLFIAVGLLSGLSGYLNRYIKLRITFNLNRKVFAKFALLPLRFFQDTSTGENLYKITSDVGQASQFISETLPRVVSIIPRALGILIIVLWIDRRMALLTLGLTPFLYIAPYYITRRLKRVIPIWIENSQALFKFLQEALSHIRLVKAFGREASEKRRYVKRLIENIRFNLANTRLEIFGGFANSLISRAIFGCIILYGGYQVIKGRLTLGAISAITIYLSQLLGLQGSFAQFFQQIATGLISLDRVEKVLSYEAGGVERQGAKDALFQKSRIEFRDISFSYHPEKVIFNGLSLCIENGSCVALIGPSGCGKTTLLNLFLRLYGLGGGMIAVDGSDIRDIKAGSFYSQIGVVLQEPYLWNDTIENNIRYGRPNAAFSEIKTAAEIARIDNFINHLSDDYNTVIGENACKISEGQKQRIAIARAVIKRPKILILDEALSSIDAETEEGIIKNIRGFLKMSTLIVISHRISTIRQMDLVYFLAPPDRVSVGSHEELLRQSRAYQNYLASQAAIVL